MSMEFFKMLNEAKLHSRMHFEGLDISVEVPAGGYRRGKNKKTGEEWAHKIKDHYGYIKGTHSPDGEHLDCYLRRNPKHNAKVYVVHQLTVDGSKFDEDKVMIGYSSQSEAVKAFKDFTFKPNVMYGGVTEFDMEHFQLAAYSASKSHAMLTNNKTFDQFKKKGLLGSNIKSPNMIARKVSESLAMGLNEIGETLYRGALEECLEWSGFNEGLEVEAVLTRAYGHYSNSDYMHELGSLSESEFREQFLSFIMEQDALATDIEDEINEECEDEVLEDLDESILQDYDHDSNPVMYTCNTSPNKIEDLEENLVMEANNFAVVIHTQIMENIGSSENPSWATAGTKVQLVQEGFANYGEARSVAAKVAAGEIPVEINEGSYVLGIDVMPTGEFRQFHESVEEEEQVEEDTTEDVFFAQQIQEVKALAGVQQGSYKNQGTPSVHETRERLEALTKSFYEAVEAEELEEHKLEGNRLSDAELAHTLRVVRETVKKNPKADINKITRAVCQKLHGDANLDEEVMSHAEFEYGSMADFDAAVRGKDAASTVVKKYN